MKVNVDKITGEGLELAEKLDPHALSLDLNEQGIVFTQSIEARASFTKTGKEVFVSVSLEAGCEYTCGRCLAKFHDIFRKKFNMDYEVNPGDILDIDEDIRQEMILDYPMKIVCKPECKGLCPNCGQNLNISKCDCEK